MMIPRKSICAFGLIILIPPLVQCEKIHEQMTDEEIVKVFRTRRDNIPEYDVATVRHNVYKRSNSTLQLEFTAFGKKIAAYLEPSDGLLAGENTPVWLAYRPVADKVHYHKLRDDMVGSVAKIFDRLTDYSTVAVIQTPDNGVYFEGVVDDLSVVPLPKRFHETPTLKPEAVPPKTSRTLLDGHRHVIFKSPLAMNESDELTNIEKEIRKIRSINDTDNSKSKRSKQDIIFPSILVTTDFENSKFALDWFFYIHEVVYQLAFWNAVDLRFRRLNNPKVRLRIAGIIIGLDRRATPYLDKYRNGNEIQMDKAWRSMQEYWAIMINRPDFPLEAYDIVMTVTDNSMTKVIDGSTQEITGTTVMNTFCAPYDELYALGISKDNGGFNGVLTATHELGHIMGLFHDGDTGDECDSSNSFIMRSGRIAGARNLQWSPCSLRGLSRFLRKDKITCADKPAEFHPPGTEVRRFLPGEIVDHHKQCQSRGYNFACDPSPEICTNMKCYYTGWSVVYGWWCKAAGPAAEGTICSPDHRCVDGVCRCMTKKCIFEENSINYIV